MLSVRDADWSKSTTWENFYAISRGWGLRPTPELLDALSHIQSPSNNVLDVGCGDGRNALFLSRLGYFVTALDNSEIALQHLVTLSLKENLYLKTISADVLKATLPSNHYSFILLDSVLQFLPRGSEHTVARTLHEALAPGGTLLVRTIVPSNDSRSSNEYALNGNELRKGLVEIFSKLKLIRISEETVLDSTHGPPHYHNTICFVGLKRPQ